MDEKASSGPSSRFRAALNPYFEAKISLRFTVVSMKWRIDIENAWEMPVVRGVNRRPERNLEAVHGARRRPEIEFRGKRS